MLFRINVYIKKRKTHRWGIFYDLWSLMFYLCFCYNARRFLDSVSTLQTRADVAENAQQRPLGSHFSAGRRIRCNTGNFPALPD